MIVPAVQDRQQVRVSNQGRLSTESRLVGGLDELVLVEACLVTCPVGLGGIDEDVQLRASQEETASRPRERILTHRASGTVVTWREAGAIERLENAA
jgi:hypothetical protein